MLADLNTALRSPWDLVQSIYEQQQPGADALAGIEGRVEKVFRSLFDGPAALGQLPCLTATTKVSSLPPPGSLVRFRAMVQDTGMGTEVFRAVSQKNELLLYGREEDLSSEAASSGNSDYRNLMERHSYYAVTVPGETEWAQKQNGSSCRTGSLTDGVASMSVSEEKATLFSKKYPLPSEPHFGCVLKLYGESAESLKITDVCDFVGILSETNLSSTFDDLADASIEAKAVTIPALHVILALPIESDKAPVASEARNSDVRNELIGYLTSALGGDSEAAEWALLALLARIHTRHPAGMALGSMSLNLALPADFDLQLNSVFSSIVPRLASIELSIPVLNDIQMRMAPRSRDETLDSGALQLAQGTTVLVDLRGIKEGKLEDAGVKNLRHLATTIAQQKLSYEFPYSSFELETDLNFVVVSEGKAIVPTDCVVYVKPSKGVEPLQSLSEDQLARFRSFLATMRNSPFTIPETMSEVIQADFVERRQKSVAGEGMTQEDLLFRMTAARLLALSKGETELSKDVWLRTAELDESRKERAPVVPKSSA